MTRLAILTFSALAGAVGSAQNVKEDPHPDPILEAIEEFHKRDRQTTNEVTVVLDPVGEPPAPVATVVKEESEEPVLVTGNPPQEVQNAEKELLADEKPPAPEIGLAVRVEKLRTGEGTLDASQVKLIAPFPAKPIAPAPPGWRLDASDSAPPFTREVEIAPGSMITLNIRPHLLIPDADGATVFSVSEPGYDKALAYEQVGTVSAILSTSIQQLEVDSMNLSTAIEQLQQLLVSLPSPETEPKTPPATRRTP